MDLAASSSWTAEFIFHGTGSSGSVPNIECLTAPKAEDPCRPCHTALTPEGKKNRRRNTGAIIRVRRQDGSFMYESPVFSVLLLCSPLLCLNPNLYGKLSFF